MIQLPDAVKNSLADSRFDWRTAEGVAQDSGSDLQAVVSMLESSPEVRRGERPNQNGKALYQLKKKETFAERLLAAFANSPA